MPAEFSMDLMHERLKSFGAMIQTVRAMSDNGKERADLTLKQQAIIAKMEEERRPIFSWRRRVAFIPVPTINPQPDLTDKKLALNLIGLDLKSLGKERKTLLQCFHFYADKHVI